MKKIVYLLLLLFTCANINAASRSEKQIEVLQKGMTIEQIRNIFGKEDFSKAINSNGRLLMYNLIRSNSFTTEYNFYFVNGKLDGITRRFEKSSPEVPVLLFETDSIADAYLNKQNVQVFSGVLDADENLTIVNKTFFDEKFSVMVFSGSNKWSVLGTTTLLRPNETYTFPHHMEHYSYFEKPVIKLAVVSESDRNFSLSVTKIGYDLNVLVEHDLSSLKNPAESPSKGVVSKEEIIHRLNILKELLDNGIISDIEYKESRIKILSTF